jgi:cytochrome c heme-lyase
MHQSIAVMAKPPTPPAEFACLYTLANLSKIKDLKAPFKYSKYNPLNYIFANLS